jgi:hypothetical protein
MPTPTSTPTPTNTPTPTLSPTATPTPSPTPSDCSTQTEPTEQDVNYALTFSGNIFETDDWQRSHTVASMRTSVTWLNDSVGALAYLEYLIYSCGYDQDDIEKYYSEQNFQEVIFSGNYQNMQRIAQCTDVTGELTLHEFRGVWQDEEYLFRMWVKLDNRTRVLSLLLVFPENSSDLLDKYSIKNFPTLDSCSRVIDPNPDQLVFVLIENKEAAYTVYFGIPKDIRDEDLEEIQAIESVEEEVSLISWEDFEQNIDEFVTAEIVKNDYEDSQVVKGIVELVQMYPMTPFGLTWNGGIAFMFSDYEHAKKIYQQYQADPDEYEETRNRDPKGDPINPQNHLGPLLGW